MKLVTFSAGGTPRIGIVKAEGIIDVARHEPHAPSDMALLIAQWAGWKDRLATLATHREPDHALDRSTLSAPVTRPGKLLAIGLNYEDHVQETGSVRPTEQFWFAKTQNTINGPFAPIEMPRVSSDLDYEAEMAVVIGRRCRHVRREEAAEVVFGYCVANDVSVRDWQRRTSQVILGKSFDTHAPLGPWIATADEVGDPHSLDIRCWVNGEERQHSNTGRMIFDCFDQIAHLSQVMTLEPGDILLTGTPAGVALGHKPPQWLREGDVVRVEIARLGAIENRVILEDASFRG